MTTKRNGVILSAAKDLYDTPLWDLFLAQQLRPVHSFSLHPADRGTGERGTIFWGMPCGTESSFDRSPGATRTALPSRPQQCSPHRNPLPARWKAVPPWRLPSASHSIECSVPACRRGRGSAIGQQRLFDPLGPAIEVRVLFGHWEPGLTLFPLILALLI